MPREPLLVKLGFVIAFLLAASITFALSGPLVEWWRSKSEVMSTLPVQAVVALPAMFLIFWIEGKIIWKLRGQGVFSTIHPVSIGAYVGYVVHFAF